MPKDFRRLPSLLLRGIGARNGEKSDVCQQGTQQHVGNYHNELQYSLREEAQAQEPDSYEEQTPKDSLELLGFDRSWKFHGNSKLRIVRLLSQGIDEQ